MKYFIATLQFILCCILSLCLTGFIVLAVFSAAATKDITIKYMKNETYINSQKAKLQSDLETVSLANGIDPVIFSGFINDQMVINNNEDYINSVFDVINGNSDVVITKKDAADEYENGLKNILNEYKKKVDPDEYKITDKGVNEFTGFQKTTFSMSAIPVEGFNTFAVYIRKILDFKCILLAVSGIGALILLLFNNKKIYKSIANILYFISASGVLTGALSGSVLWVITSKSTVLSSSYLKSVVQSYCTSALITGIAIFLAAQIALLTLMLIVKHKRRAD